MSLTGDLISSVHNAASATSSSVVMAYWPGRGNNLSTIDYSSRHRSVFFKHDVMICSAENVQKNIKLVFAYVYWKQKHPRDRIQIVAREKLLKSCWLVSYPNHPQHSRWQQCGAPLLKSVRSGRGHRLVPIKVFPYMPIQKSLQNLASRPVLVNNGDRAATVPSGYLGDIYDGRVWHNFHSATGYDFHHCHTY